MTDQTDDARAATAAAAYWGLGPRRLANVAGLAPPPRALTIGMEEYLATKTKSAWGWVVAAGVFVGGSMLPFQPLYAVGSVAVFAIAFMMRKETLARRAKLRDVLENGTLVHSTVEQVHGTNHSTHSPIAGRMIVGDRVLTRVTLVLDGGRRIRYETWDSGLGALLQPGLNFELLVHPAHPDLVVSTLELPPG